jgi:hypothetical protein
MYWVEHTLAPIAAISFLVIQWRVGLGRTSWYDGSRTQGSIAERNGAPSSIVVPPGSAVRVVAKDAADIIELNDLKHDSQNHGV